MHMDIGIKILRLNDSFAGIKSPHTVRKCDKLFRNKYCKLPLISPGLIQVRKGFWVGL